MSSAAIRQLLKQSLKVPYNLDIKLKVKNSSKTQISHVAAKLYTLNFPRMIKRCLIQVPKSMEEVELPSRQNLVGAIRNLYKSGKDKPTFDMILDMASQDNRGLIIDAAASPFYANIGQLPLMYRHLTQPRQIPGGFKNNFIQKHLKQFHLLHESGQSKLFHMLESYNPETDTVEQSYQQEADEQLDLSAPFLQQMSPEEKDVIFETVLIGRPREDPGLVPVYPRTAGLFQNKDFKFHHTVVRGTMIYTEFKVDGILFGCGLDFSHRPSSRRLLRMAYLNPSFEAHVREHLPHRVPIYEIAKAEVLDLEIA